MKKEKLKVKLREYIKKASGETMTADEQEGMIDDLLDITNFSDAKVYCEYYGEKIKKVGIIIHGEDHSSKKIYLCFDVSNEFDKIDW